MKKATEKALLKCIKQLQYSKRWGLWLFPALIMETKPSDMSYSEHTKNLIVMFDIDPDEFYLVKEQATTTGVNSKMATEYWNKLAPILEQEMAVNK